MFIFGFASLTLAFEIDQILSLSSKSSLVIDSAFLLKVSLQIHPYLDVYKKRVAFY